MNEFEFGNKLAHLLDQGARSVDAGVVERLRAARATALAHAARRSLRVGLAGGGEFHLNDFRPGIANLLMAVVVALAVAGFAYWNDQQRIAEAEEVDSALLADDLPIDAYLDSGFGEWLKRSSQP